MEFLINTPFYKELNIKLTEECKNFDGCEQNVLNCVTIDESNNLNELLIDENSNQIDDIDLSVDSDIDESNIGCTETLLTNSQIS